jgi:hypothetical protein
MGTLLNNFMYTGRLGPSSAYTMRGHDKIVIRSRGGATKQVIQTSPKFEVTRQLNQEWKAVVKAAGVIRNGLHGLKPMADYNVSGPLNALVKKLQTTDLVNPKGRRSILFSRQPEFFSSFQFNRQNLFNSVIRQSFEVSIDKTSVTANVTIPVLQPSINIFADTRYAYYRFVFCFDTVSDYVWDEDANLFKVLNSQLPDFKPAHTDWSPVSSTQPEKSCQIAPFLPGFSIIPDMMFFFGGGIQYGMPAPDGSIQPVPYAGAARILKCV